MSKRTNKPDPVYVAMPDTERLATQSDHDRDLDKCAVLFFRDVADKDYIAARLAYAAQLPGQFLWASQQALEKYLKCALLLRRMPARDVKHDLAEAIRLIDKAQIPLDLTDAAKRFIEEIDAVGQYRYLETSYLVSWHMLLPLDQTVWEIRRFCTLEPAVTALRLTKDTPPPRLHIQGGYLEMVVENRKHPARRPLLWQNGYWGRARRTVRLHAAGGAVAISPLHRNTERLIDELAKYIHLPGGEIKEHARREREAAAKQAR